jgi:hypothetical protein
MKERSKPEETMSWIMVDIEADGPMPGDYSIISFGAVVVEPGLERTFYGELRPISKDYVSEALAVSGFTREKTLEIPPESVMRCFAACIGEVITDRCLFPAPLFRLAVHQQVFPPLHRTNPFGFLSTNLKSLYKDLVGDTTKNFKPCGKPDVRTTRWMMPKETPRRLWRCDVN